LKSNLHELKGHKRNERYGEPQRLMHPTKYDAANPRPDLEQAIAR
jgi:hypothetical protein